MTVAADTRDAAESPRDMPADAFRDAMAALAATACVVTARLGGTRLGRTVTAVLSLSVAPPTILVSIDASAPLAAMIRDTRGFSLALLSDTQQTIADAFAGRVTAENRFDHGTWRDWSSGNPQLTRAVASMDCRLTGTMQAGDHALFLGGVREIANEPDQTPLVWHRRRYSAVSPLLQE